jgi:hypothetical protein
MSRTAAVPSGPRRTRRVTALAIEEVHLGELHPVEILDRASRKAKPRANIDGYQNRRRTSVAENGREVCLEEEVERLRRFGMSAVEISRTMGVDQAWVEALLSTWHEGPSAEDHG